MAQIDPNFTRYLDSLDFHRNLVAWGFGISLVVIIGGIRLIYVMRKHQSQHKFETRIEKVYVNFGSTNPGSFVVLIGGLIMAISIWVSQYSIPKVNFTPNGWTTSQNQNDENSHAKLKAIANEDLPKTNLTVVTTQKQELEGYLVSTDKHSQLEEAGLEAIKVDTADLNPKIKGLDKLKDKFGNVLFVPDKNPYEAQVEANGTASRAKVDYTPYRPKVPSDGIEAIIKAPPKAAHR